MCLLCLIIPNSTKFFPLISDEYICLFCSNMFFVYIRPYFSKAIVVLSLCLWWAFLILFFCMSILDQEGFEPPIFSILQLSTQKNIFLRIELTWEKNLFQLSFKYSIWLIYIDKKFIIINNLWSLTILWKCYMNPVV